MTDDREALVDSLKHAYWAHREVPGRHDVARGLGGPCQDDCIPEIAARLSVLWHERWPDSGNPERFDRSWWHYADDCPVPPGPHPDSGIDELLDGLAKRHEWVPGGGPCICEWHERWRALSTPRTETSE